MPSVHGGGAAGGRPKVLASIVTYNSQALIGECVARLRACDAGEVELYVSIADNSPGDETWKVLGGLEAPNVRAFRSPSNLGWSRGNNLAVARGVAEFGVEPDFVLLLNPDALIEDGSLAAAAAALAAHPRAAVAAGRFAEEGEEAAPAFQPDWGLADILFQFAGVRVPRSRRLRRRLAGRSGGAVEVGGATASGAAMAIRWSVFREIGGLDERYFLYWDDVDLTRTVRQKGHTVLFCPGLVVRHQGGASSDTLAGDRAESEVRKQRYMLESLESYVEKWYGKRAARFVRWYEPRVTWRARLLKSAVRPGGPISAEVARSMIRHGTEPKR